MRKYFVFLLLISLFFISCENEIRYKFQQAPKQMVLYCFFSPDSIWKARVYKMQNISNEINDSLFYVNNATVKLFQNNTFVEQLIYTGKGIYQSKNNTRPVEGKKYRLLVEAKGFPDIETKNEMLPHKAQIKMISYIDSVALSYFYLDDDDEYWWRKGNFYTYKCEIKNATIAYIDAKVSNLDYLPSYSEIDENKYFESWLSSFLEMHDKTDTVTFVLSCRNYNYSLYDSIRNKKFIEVSIRNVNEEYKKFYNASYRQFDEQTSDVGIFYTPTDFYSNMKKGVGIFTGISGATKIKLPFEPPDEDYFN